MDISNGKMACLSCNDLRVSFSIQKKTAPFIGKQLVKVFTGQRRVGKSYVLKQTAVHITRAGRAILQTPPGFM
ncbi:MAG: hypothetical protein FWB94_10515 [Chitinispirillia bacterium]|nr:hypothetical protein [Chitinispirillia bacterium]